jgi:arylsulfatase A-like enzyme
MNKRIYLFAGLLQGLSATGFLSVAGNIPVPQTRNERPNIILIISDDLGYGDLGCYGQEKIKTPNIDRIAAEGIRFTQAYAGSAVCAPSRSALMEGKHTGHARVRGNYYKDYRESLQPGDYTIAMMLKEAGYVTGLFGKWGLGLHNQYGIPGRMGFDQFFGYLNQGHAHNYYPEFLWENEHKVYFPENGCHHSSSEIYNGNQFYDENGICHPQCIEDPAKASYSLDVYAAKSLEFIRRNSKEPFFLTLAYTPPHKAFIVPELGIYHKKDWPLSHKIYAAMITRMDSEVGKLLDLLDELNIDENTMILFTSDNGNIYGNAGPGEQPFSRFFNNLSPTRGGKGNILSGAFHVPAVLRWPKVISPGQVSNHVWAFWDIMPTLADITGLEPPADSDGISFYPILRGDSDMQRVQRFLYWEYDGEQAVKMGNWYGVRNLQGDLRIFDLEKDPGQHSDLSHKYPEIADKIAKIMKAEHIPSTTWPSPSETEEEFRTRLKQANIPEKPVNRNVY